MREQGSDTYRSMQDAFGRDTPHIKAAMEIASNETIKQAVIAGMGVSFLSSHAIALDVRAGEPRRARRRRLPGVAALVRRPSRGRSGCRRSRRRFGRSCWRTARG